MLAELYPRMHRRFASLPVLGPVMDAFAEWLVGHGYSGDRVREGPPCGPTSRPAVGASWGTLPAHANATTASRLCADRLAGRSGSRGAGAVVGAVLRADGAIPAARADRSRATGRRLRGLPAGGPRIRAVDRASALSDDDRLPPFPPGDARAARAPDRSGSRSVPPTPWTAPRPCLFAYEVAHLRALVRFLVVRREGPVGLDSAIDTPRVDPRRAVAARTAMGDGSGVAHGHRPADLSRSAGLRQMFLLIAHARAARQRGRGAYRGRPRLARSGASVCASVRQVRCCGCR